ncbi:hypothetical protein DB91_04170 [Ehrlichia sp. Wisconsin_h]|uniref:Uncharacterized protein n=1 Tax=Ehrlichia cf. muris str. EmCRT TaxID=1359167 RepID=A0A0F3NDS7_9RICK|nr:hypothetical protein EMUCRT_0053 [Ehrlichia cf. muris str. EmCRT]OUC04130.1 hypothetical protein DB91_04170 [Ehrlichia sp. Wisconsin_h]
MIFFINIRLISYCISYGTGKWRLARNNLFINYIVIKNYMEICSICEWEGVALGYFLYIITRCITLYKVSL